MLMVYYIILVYLPTFTIKINQMIGKYTSPMDSLGFIEIVYLES